MKVVPISELASAASSAYVDIFITPDAGIRAHAANKNGEYCALNIGTRVTLYCHDPHELARTITAAAVQAGIPAPQPQPQASEGAAHE